MLFVDASLLLVSLPIEDSVGYVVVDSDVTVHVLVAAYFFFVLYCSSLRSSVSTVILLV